MKLVNILFFSPNVFLCQSRLLKRTLSGRIVDQVFKTVILEQYLLLDEYAEKHLTLQRLFAVSIFHICVFMKLSINIY